MWQALERKLKLAGNGKSVSFKQESSVPSLVPVESEDADCKQPDVLAALDQASPCPVTATLRSPEISRVVSAAFRRAVRPDWICS